MLMRRKLPTRRTLVGMFAICSLSEFCVNGGDAVCVDEVDRFHDEQIRRKSSDEDFSFGVACHRARGLTVNRDGES